MWCVEGEAGVCVCVCLCGGVQCLCMKLCTLVRTYVYAINYKCMYVKLIEYNEQS